MIPKGTSMKKYNQNDCNHIMSQANSHIRKNLVGKTPFEVFSELYNATVQH